MLKKGTVRLNKPIQVGAVVLSRSKLHMLRMRYEKITPWWPGRVRCLYTDTDSLILEVQTENVYQDLQLHLADDPPTLDTSNFPKSHVLFSNQHKKVPGPMKDECAGLPLEEVVLLAPNVKALRYASHDDFTGKGLKKHLLKKLTFQEYRDALQERMKEETFDAIRSSGHHLYTISCTKRGFTAFDSKRWCEDGLHTLPFGHYAITDCSTEAPSSSSGTPSEVASSSSSGNTVGEKRLRVASSSSGSSSVGVKRQRRGAMSSSSSSC